VHDRMCGQGSYDKIMACLGFLKIKKIKTNILALIAKQNLDFFDDILETASGFGASVVFQPVAGQDGIGSGMQECVPEEDAFKKAVIKLIGRKKNGAPIASSAGYLSLLKDHWPHMPHGTICYAGRLFCNVDPEGNVVPCCSKLSGRDLRQPGAKIGFKEAFGRIQDVSCCSSCYYFGPQEINLFPLFSMKGRSF